MRSVAIALVLGAASASAQEVRKSQLATLTQQVANAKIEVTYRRPVARGRALFGALVQYGKIWTPSADSAARITFSAPVTVNGEPLAAGTYSVWAIPDSISWTVLFNTVGASHHLVHTDGQDILRVHAAPLKGSHVESLMFSMPMVDADSATLAFAWGTTVVPLMIRAAH